ncbi:hypothetical protein P2318_01395 [Myxococcaceae bacterium GXIMD 01537]
MRRVLTAWMMCLVLSGCVGAARHRYSMDTVSNTCRSSPVQCVAQASMSEGARASAQAAASAGASLAAAAHGLEELERAQVEQALNECADWVRSEVLLREMDGRSPTPEECREIVGKNARGEAVTRAMQLGERMHQYASECAGSRLEEVIPGRFSLEQRFRYSRETGRTEVVTRSEAEALLARGRGRELLGTLQPDVVIHLGHPLHAQAIYDFKFPCVNSNADVSTPWRQYPDGHPYAGLTQKRMYEEALKVDKRAIKRIVPRWGALP